MALELVGTEYAMQYKAKKTRQKNISKVKTK
jgi:hypothetical protein